MPGDTRWWFTLVMGLVIAERLVELVLSRRNERWARARGGVEVGAGHYPFMVVMHSMFLGSCLFEVWVVGRPFIPWLAATCLALLGASMGLRYWAVSSLGRRWTTRVICLPGEPLVARGPYRFVRHPNYVAVVAEVLALPLIHTAWVTALLFSITNMFLLRVRIRVEDQALKEYSS